MKSKFATAAIAALAMGGCAGWDGYWNDLCGTPQVYTHKSIPLGEVPAFPRYCLEGDVEVADYSQCAASEWTCYQLDTGNWCIGAYSAACPAGATPIEMNTTCPVAGACWTHVTGQRCYST